MKVGLLELSTHGGEIKLEFSVMKIQILFSHHVHSSPLTHRDLKSDSHKRFGNRDFACWAYILDYGESKKGCLNYFRNRSAHTFLGTFVKYNG